MRQMYDSVTSADIPTDAPMVAGYVDGKYAWTPGDWQRHADAIRVQISVNPAGNIGDVLDVEQGNGTPDQAPGWVLRRRAAGVNPTIYCSASAWPGLRAEFAKARVNTPQWWIAQWNGQQDLPAGAIAKQYADATMIGHHYDLSVVAAHWPGIDDPATAPPTPEPAHAHTYVVQPGDTLTAIGKRFGVPWQSIYAANDHVIGNDPDRILPGQHLTIPSHTRTVTVQHGDTLSGIGERLGVDWHSIYEANKALIGDDPGKIYPGQILVVPQ